MSNDKFIGEAKARVSIHRNGQMIPFGETGPCTQSELDGGYFDKETFKPYSEQKPKSEEKMMASPDNKSMAGKTKKKKAKD